MSGEKRSQDNAEDAQRDEKIIIVDIEGTTTSISFVKDTLFPYVRNNLKEYIEKNWENAEFKEDVKKLKEQATKDAADKVEGLVAITETTVDDEKESLMKNAIWQMDNDRKTGALKQLQGHMWREAYKSGAVKGHVYEDVPKSFEAWTKAGRKIYVYSSGSVEAQKLLFENSEKGDLLKYLTDYFDTEIGGKQQVSSYKNILKKIETDGKNVLFLTDIPNEAKAAIDAGMSSIIVVRDGNTDLTVDEKSTYTTIKTFDDLSFNVSAKRAKIEESTTDTDNKNTEKSDKVDDVEMKDVSDAKDDDDKKSVDEKKDVDDKTTKDEVKKNDAADKTDDEKKKKDDEKTKEKPKEIEKIDETIVKASTSDEKMETEIVEKKVDDVVKEKIDVKTSIKTTDEKTDKKIVEKEEKKLNTETDDVKKSDTDKVNKTETEKVKKIDTDKTNNDVSKPETSKTDDKNKNEEELAEKVKNDDKKTDDKPAVATEEVKQNGDSKVAEKKDNETKVTNGKKAELNGSSKKPEITEEKKAEVTGEVEKIDDAKVDTVKDDEKSKEEQQVNGNSVDAKEKNHRNGVNEEKSKNGESSTTEVDSIKVTKVKVVEKIADGAGEADVTPPVAVVAATS